MNAHDVRWQQRFASYNKALAQLKNAVVLSSNEHSLNCLKSCKRK